MKWWSERGASDRERQTRKPTVKVMDLKVRAQCPLVLLIKVGGYDIKPFL